MQNNIESTAQYFFDIDQWHGSTPIGDGNINDTYRIDFERNGARVSYILQRLNHLIFKQPQDVMHNWQAVAAHLQHHGFSYKIPMPIATLKEGNLLHQDASGNYWRAFPFFENTFSPENAATPAVAYEAAKAFGAFLTALDRFPASSLAETIPGFHDTERRWVYFLEVLEKNHDNRKATAAAEIKKMFQILPIFQKINQLKTNGTLPLRATHNDTKAGNVLLDRESGRAVAVIDWDTLMPGTTLSDFGDMVRSFAPSHPENHANTEQLYIREEVVEVLCRGFLESSQSFLTTAEREHLFLGAQWIIGEQALRFLSDFLDGDKYYKTAYPEHNLVRTRNQLALWEKITAREDLFHKFLS